MIMKTERGPLRGPIAIALAIVPLVLIGDLPTATLYVDDNTCPATGSGTQASPYCHIQDAICVASSGDAVSVAPGTYPEAIRMKPGVSVTSQGGAAVTTINSSGKPCTDSSFCAKRTGTKCSVVTFSVGHTPATVLDGFTLTGGGGQDPNAPVVTAGGGIFVFSSPTIRNNIIQNNVLTGTRRQFVGGGIYVSVGAPVITNNTIAGNRAVPAAGVSGATTFGYGGGIYSSFFSTPQITGNTIQGNRAGDPNLAFSLGAGGGVAVFAPDANTPGTVVIDRNLIADNVTDTEGGGVSLGSLANTIRESVVTNNVIVGNLAYRGGGLYTYLNKNSVVNNTIVANNAELGGGVFSGDSDVTLPTIISNNVITGNNLMLAGSGGGLYKKDFGAAPSTSLESNDVFGNQKNQVAGDPSDATFFTTNGNFSLDPKYVNAPTRDYHVNPNSPLIDRALATRAPPVDRENTARGYDGDGIPNYPMAGDVDVGAYEWRPACASQPEICDGIDNNCNAQIDEGFPDMDHDGVADCVDPDIDSDGAPNGGDCAPYDASAFGVPAEIQDLMAVEGAPPQVTWTNQMIGSGTRYQIATGQISGTGPITFSAGSCLPSVSSSPAPVSAVPSLGTAFYYMVKPVNACGASTYGSPARDAHPACP